MPEIGSHLAPLADSPLWTWVVIAYFGVHPLEFTAFPVQQPTAPIVHTKRLSDTTPASTCLRALFTKIYEPYNSIYLYTLYS